MSHVLNEITRKQIVSVTPLSIAYVGEATGVDLPGIGQVMIMAADKEKLSRTFSLLVNGIEPDPSKFKKLVAMDHEATQSHGMCD